MELRKWQLSGLNKLNHIRPSYRKLLWGSAPQVHQWIPKNDNKKAQQGRLEQAQLAKMLFATTCTSIMSQVWKDSNLTALPRFHTFTNSITLLPL
jgi:hypothetical protein